MSTNKDTRYDEWPNSGRWRHHLLRKNWIELGCDWRWWRMNLYEMAKTNHRDLPNQPWITEPRYHCWYARFIDGSVRMWKIDNIFVASWIDEKILISGCWQGNHTEEGNNGWCFNDRSWLSFSVRHRLGPKLRRTTDQIYCLVRNYIVHVQYGVNLTTPQLISSKLYIHVT